MNKHGRLIDADVLGNRMYHEVFEKDTEDQRWDSGCWMRYRLFEKVLRDAPTVKPDRKKGKWIYGGTTGDQYNYAEWFSCSCCKRQKIKKSNFCPYCGADMREGEA